jgi:nucleoid DNA-binding protein
MPKTTKKTIVAAIVRSTGIPTSKAQQGLETVLDSIKKALREGRSVDIGSLGRLSVVVRLPICRIGKNLKHVGPNIDRVYKKHPRTVRLTNRRDLSKPPQPTVVTEVIKHKELRPTVSTRTAQVAIAFTSWRRR